MALPTISNNTPSAGHISWTAFGIQYNGQSFGIPSGSTSKKFVWWLYGGGTSPALMDGNELPTLGSDDMILFLNKTGIGVLVPTAELMDGSLIVNGSILAGAISANSIQTYHLDSNVITADEIAANAIQTKHLSAGTITADKLSVGTVSDNMVVNGSFEDALSGTLVGWEISAMTNGTITPVSGQSSSGAVSMQLVATTTAANLRFRQLPAQYIPVSAASGRKYYISVRAGASVATTSGHYMRVNWYDGAKALISSSDIRSNAALTQTFTLYEGQATPPATARYMGMEVLVTNLNVPTTVYIDEISAHEVTMAAQIGDGQITAAKILANTITADRIQTGSITADKLLVSDRTNYWENPDFEADAVGAIPKGTTLTATTNARILNGGSQGSARSLELNALSTGNTDVFSTNIFPVEPGDQFYIRHDYKFLNAAGTAGGGVGFRTYGPTKASITWTGVATSTGRPTAWTTHPGAIYTVPAGTYFLQPWVYFSNNAETTNRFHIDDIIIRRMSGGELIVDGAIIAAKIDTDAVTAVKIQANAITSVKIAANAITANHISANAVTATSILANSVSASHIAANTITAREIATNAITANLISAGAIDGKTITGATIIGGELKTVATAGAIAARMGPTVTWDVGANTTRPGIGFSVNGNTDDPAGMYSPTGTDLMLTQGGLPSAGALAWLKLGDNALLAYSNDHTDVASRLQTTIRSDFGTVDLEGNSGVRVGGVEIDAVHHAEFTGSMATPHAQLWGPGPLTEDTTKRRGTPTFYAAQGTNDRLVLQEGVWAVHVRASATVNLSGASWVSFSNDDGSIEYDSVDIPAGKMNGTISVPNLLITSPSSIVRLRFYHESGGYRTINTRVRVTRLSPL